MLKVDSGVKVLRRPESETLLFVLVKHLKPHDSLLERMFEMLSICRSRRPL